VFDRDVTFDVTLRKGGYHQCPEATAQQIRFWTIGQGRSQEFATGGQKTPVGSRGRAPVEVWGGLGAKPSEAGDMLD